MVDIRINKRAKRAEIIVPTDLYSALSDAANPDRTVTPAQFIAAFKRWSAALSQPEDGVQQ